ncbi:MAG: S9 family peptidase [Acidimicrobiales bacterium]|nr:S9 family peptidase [Hyphomonadaceae bacterium]RZV36877.1 MAG: S9 family peptidase [Acidimicrobiales bacterium]
MRFLSVMAIGFFLNFAVSLAVAKPVPAEHYARMPAVYDATISPDGNFLATIVDNNGEYILRVFNLGNPADNTLRASGLGKGVQVKTIMWANNDQILIRTRQTRNQGDIIYNTGHLYVVDKNVEDVTPVLKAKNQQGGASRFNKQRTVRQFNDDVIDYLPDDPDHILMSFGLEDQLAPDVYKVNIKNLSQKKIKNGAPNIQNWITDLHGEVRVSKGQVDVSGEYHLAIRDANGDTWRSIADYPGLDSNTNIVGFMEDPNHMIVASRNGKDTLGLYIYDLAQKRQTRKLLHNDQYDVSDIIMSPDGKKVVGAKYVGDVGERVFFDPVYKSRFDKIEAKLPDYQINILDQTPDGKKVIFKASTPSVPGILYAYNSATGKLDNLGYDYPEISKTLQGDITKVKYSARDGFKITGYLTTPPAIADGMPFKNQPFVILPHGGPYARDAQSFDYFAQYFSSRGYSVLQMNFRGSSGLGLAHQQAGRKNWEVMQEDIEDGARWLASKGYADPKRICIAGWSFGGYAALMGAIKNPDLYACAISVAGVTDLFDLINDRKKYVLGRHVAKSSIISGFKNSDAIKENSPVKRADELTVPVLLAHGTMDVTVHYDQFTRMKNALGKSKAKKTYVVLKDGNHGLTSTAHRTKLLTAMDKFLLANLGESAAAP